MSLHIQPGQPLGDRYQAVRFVAEGGMGVVWAARGPDGTEVAIKLLSPALFGDEPALKRFLKEAECTKGIDSEHIVSTLAHGIDANLGVPWYTMPLLSGQTLDARLSDSDALERNDRRKFAAECSRQLCLALGAAHGAGLVHRDVKPENIFLLPTQDPQRFTLKLFDFGIAASAVGGGAVTTGLGSYLWTSPEQAYTGTALAPSMDIWPLGLIAFRILTGRCYWLAASTESSFVQLFNEVLYAPLVFASARAGALQVNADELPGAFDEWFGRCVTRSPERRFQSAKEADDAFQLMLKGARARAPVERTVLLPSARPLLPEKAWDRSAFDAALSLGNVRAAVEALFSSPRALMEPDWTLKHLIDVAARCPTVRGALLPEQCATIFRILVEARREESCARRLDSLFRDPEPSRGVALLPVAGQSGSPGTLRLLRVRARAASDGAQRFSGRYAPRAAFCEAVDAAHALAEQAVGAPADHCASTTVWSLEPDLESNADLDGGSVALAAFVALASHVLDLLVDPAFAFTGVCQGAEMAAPPAATLPDKLQALRERPALRTLWCAGRPDVAALRRDSAIADRLRVPHGSRPLDLLVEIFGVLPHDVQRRMRSSLPPAPAPPALVARALALLAAAGGAWLDAQSIVRALRSSAWPSPLSELDRVDAGIEDALESLTATHGVQSRQTGQGLRHAVYCWPELAADAPATMLRSAHAAHAEVRPGLYHRLLGGQPDALATALLDVAPFDIDLGTIVTDLTRVADKAPPVAVSAVSALEARLAHEQRPTLPAHRLLLWWRTRGLGQPWRALGSQCVLASSQVHVLLALQSLVEALLHAVVTVELLERGDQVATGVSRMSERPSIGQLWEQVEGHARSHPQHVAAAIVAAFDSIQPARDLNTWLHTRGAWWRLGESDVQNAKLHDTCATYARRTANALAALEAARLTAFTGPGPWARVASLGEAAGLVALGRDTDPCFYRGVIDGNVRFWSFATLDELRTPLPDGIDPAKLLFDQALRLQLAAPSAYRPDALPSAQVRIDRLPQPVARAVAALRRKGAPPLARLSAIDLALASLLRLELAALLASGGTLARSATLARMTKRALRDELAGADAAKLTSALGQQCVQHVATSSHLLALIGALERFEHGPIAVEDRDLEAPAAWLSHVLAGCPWHDLGVETWLRSASDAWRLDGVNTLAPRRGSALPEGVSLKLGSDVLPLGDNVSASTSPRVELLLMAEKKSSRHPASWYTVQVSGKYEEGGV